MKIRDKGFIELHVEETNNLKQIFKVLERLGYRLVALVNVKLNQVDAEILEETRLLVLTKLYVTRENIYKLDKFYMYDLVSIHPWDRFSLNKFIRRREIDMVTLTPENLRVAPTKDQVKAMVEEGKAIEVLIKGFLHDVSKIKPLANYIRNILTVDDITIIISQGISNMYDLVNPRDVYTLLRVFLELDRYWVRKLLDEAIKFIVDTMYRKGVSCG